MAGLCAGGLQNLRDDPLQRGAVAFGVSTGRDAAGIPASGRPVCVGIVADALRGERIPVPVPDPAPFIMRHARHARQRIMLPKLGT